MWETLFFPHRPTAGNSSTSYTPQCVGPAGRDAYYVVSYDVLVMFRAIMQHEVVCGTRVYLRGEYVHHNWPRRLAGQDRLGGRSQLVSVLGSSRVKTRHRRGKKSSRGHCCHLCCRLLVERTVTSLYSVEDYNSTTPPTRLLLLTWFSQEPPGLVRKK